MSSALLDALGDEEWAEVLEILAANPAAALDLDDQRRTALHWLFNDEADEADTLPILFALLGQGAPLDALNAQGQSPLMLAAAVPAPRAVQALLRAGADATLSDAAGEAAADAMLRAALADGVVSAEEQAMVDLLRARQLAPAREREQRERADADMRRKLDEAVTEGALLRATLGKGKSDVELVHAAERRQRAGQLEELARAKDEAVEGRDAAEAALAELRLVLVQAARAEEKLQATCAAHKAAQDVAEKQVAQLRLPHDTTSSSQRNAALQSTRSPADVATIKEMTAKAQGADRDAERLRAELGAARASCEMLQVEIEREQETSERRGDRGREQAEELTATKAQHASLQREFDQLQRVLDQTAAAADQASRTHLNRTSSLVSEAAGAEVALADSRRALAAATQRAENAEREQTKEPSASSEAAEPSCATAAPAAQATEPLALAPMQLQRQFSELQGQAVARLQVQVDRLTSELAAERRSAGAVGSAKPDLTSKMASVSSLVAKGADGSPSSMEQALQLKLDEYVGEHEKLQQALATSLSISATCLSERAVLLQLGIIASESPLPPGLEAGLKD